MNADFRKNLVQAQLDAYNSRNLEAFCQCYHQEVEVHQLIENKKLLNGKADFECLYEKIFKTYPNQICHLKSRIVTNNSVIDEELITGRSSHPDGLHVVAVYGFRDELIDRVWFI